MEIKPESYICGQWYRSEKQSILFTDPCNGQVLGDMSSSGLDYSQMIDYGREVGGPALRKLDLHDRANRLKAAALHLMEHKEDFYRLSSFTGATRQDSWVDIEGGTGTLFTYSSLVRRELPSTPVYMEADVAELSKSGSFKGRHLMVPKEGVAVLINAYNFPCWGMLEKLAPALAAGMPVVVKPAPQTAYLAWAMVQQLIAGQFFPEGAIQLVCGAAGDMLDHLGEQDVVAFTGSAETGRKLKTHPTIIARNVSFNMEADSLNCSILCPDASPGSVDFDLYIKEVAREMTAKAGQKCTAVRRAIVPRQYLDAVAEALTKRLSKTVLGDVRQEAVRMGPLVSKLQQQKVIDDTRQLAEQGCELLLGGNSEFEVLGGEFDQGAFVQPTLLRCDNPLSCAIAHELEVFGPVATLMPFDDTEQVPELARMGRGSLVASLFGNDSSSLQQLVMAMAPWHGRLLVLNSSCAKESTGHGSPMPTLNHGGPGRAGGGEELGGLRALSHYMQRTAIQGHPDMLTELGSEWVRGATVHETVIHPFRKYFEELEVGETLMTHRRTVTEADIVNFACLSGDHFYAHMDEKAATESMFGKRVIHGYFLVSAAAGLFVDPAPGPVLANYGIDNLRFIEPVGIGDTISVRLTVKRKSKRNRRPDDLQASGVVAWDVEITNQEGQAVALYDILTLVACRSES